MDINIRKINNTNLEMIITDTNVNIETGLLSHSEQLEIAELFIKSAEELLSNIGKYGLECNLLDLVYDNI
jgi:hypothetical protein